MRQQRSASVGHVPQLPPRVFDHAGVCLEHRPLKSSQVPATAQVILQLATQQRCQVEAVARGNLCGLLKKCRHAPLGRREFVHGFGGEWLHAERQDRPQELGKLK